ncbi:MAG: DUF507 family protein [Candidatus Acidiferrales bacterium]
MRLSKEYVEYLSRAMVQRLLSSGVIETSNPDPVREAISHTVLDELAIEDRINDKVREYMNQYADEIRRSGVSYQDMFKRIKSELVRREKVIL